jgi:hypothetical protein
MNVTRWGIPLLFLTVVWSAEEFDIISRSSPSPGTDRIRIDRPKPTQRSVDYPQITFQPGDAVTITAGGCVQSGGHGDTWHRYVNPSGGDADKLYHGLITIPFATGVLERIQKYQNATVVVAANAPPGNLHLQLGFEDDNYSDNGYWGHDNGPNNQCGGTDGGPAWVVLTVVHHGTGGTQGGTGDFDLLWTQFDDNGIPLNPDWRAHAQKHQFPDPASCHWPWQSKSNKPECTNQITNTDTYSVCQIFSENFGFGGHANWIAATNTGWLRWEEKSIPTQDDEYSINMVTPGAAGATFSRPDGVHVEFDSDETIDPLSDDFKIPFWKAFKSAVDAGDSQAHAFLDGKEAIVTGLMGLDFAHSPGPENHPAWSLAVHSNTDFADDTWAFYIRGWGNEGYCSGDQHYISYVGNQYTFRFRWPSGATAGTVKSTQFLTNAKGVTATISFVPNQAVLLTFQNLPDPSAQDLVAGELHISWAGSPTVVITRQTPPSTVRTPPEAAEAYVDNAVGRLNPAQRAIYDGAAPKKVRAPAKPVTAVQAKTGPPVKIAANLHPQVRAAADSKLVAQKDGQIAALKKAFGGTIPNATPAKK